MITCLCEAVSDRVIRQTIRDGARTVRDVRHACGAGRQCGSCVCDIKQMLVEARAERVERADVPYLRLVAAAK